MRCGIAIMDGTRESAILRSDIREIITETNQEPRCPLTRIYKGIDLLSHEKHQAYRLSSIQEAVGLLSDTLPIELLRGNENYHRNEVANLSQIFNGPQRNVV